MRDWNDMDRLDAGLYDLVGGTLVGGTLLLLLMLCSGCSSVPSERYGIDEVEYEGVNVLDTYALNACLATRARANMTIQFGMATEAACGVPPFDASPLRLQLWRWPWREWPLFDEIVFDRDLSRIVRWYQARGYYDAEVIDWQIEPSAAMWSDTVEEDTECEREGSDEGCLVSITITVFEGEPIRITELQLTGTEGLPGELTAEIRSSLIQLSEGDIFDEANYDEAKDAIQVALVEASYARAKVVGIVQIDRDLREVQVEIRMSPGPPCVLGRITVEGNEDLVAIAVREATGFERGQPYSSSGIREAQAAVYELDAFAAVTVRPTIPTFGNVVDVVVDVVPAQRMRFQVGAGIQSGIVEQGTSENRDEVPQWDFHAVASWEHRNLFGDLRRLRIEDRPRLVFPDSFPSADEPSFGNILGVTFSQPAFIEPRTTLTIDTKWEAGPDPFLSIFRHEIQGGLGFERMFLHRTLFASAGIRERLYVVPGNPEPEIAGTTVPSDTDLLYFEQLFRLDLRDVPVRTRSGMYASLSLHESGYLLPSSWTYIRVLPDIRAYIPMSWDMVLLARFALGAVFLEDSEPGLDELSRQLGPTTARLRGGGGSANRGFFAGELGDGPGGGIRRWLATLEVRLPVTPDFYLTLFADAGDVSAEPVFRFDHPQTTLGFGFRLLTLIGPVRLDFGWRVPELQVLADEDTRSPGGRHTDIDLLFASFPGAFNLTLGDPF